MDMMFLGSEHNRACYDNFLLLMVPETVKEKDCGFWNPHRYIIAQLFFGMHSGPRLMRLFSIYQSPSFIHTLRKSCL